MNVFECHVDIDATDKCYLRKLIYCDGKTDKGLCIYELQSLILNASELVNGKKI